MRNQITNEEFRWKTMVSDIAPRIARSKWSKVTGAQNRSRVATATGHNVGTPPTRWTDDLLRDAGIRWMHAAQQQ